MCIRDSDEAVMMRLIKKLRYKTVTEFYQDMANETRDANDIIEKYLELKKKETENREDIVYRSAENFSMQTAQDDKTFKEDGPSPVKKPLLNKSY